MNIKITNLDIEALIDGALEPEEEIRVRGMVESSPQHLKRYHQLMHQKYLIQQWWEQEKGKLLQ